MIVPGGGGDGRAHAARKAARHIEAAKSKAPEGRRGRWLGGQAGTTEGHRAARWRAAARGGLQNVAVRGGAAISVITLAWRRITYFAKDGGPDGSRGAGKIGRTAMPRFIGEQRKSEGFLRVTGDAERVGEEDFDTEKGGA